jgi:glycosyltransferase involved in cell wall biosynthesis
MRFLFRRAFGKADAAVRLSHDAPEDGKAIGAKREYIIPYGIDDPTAEFPRRQAIVGDLSTSGTHTSGLHVLFVGMMCESKGVLVLLEACRVLLDRGVCFHLDMMGQFESAEFESLVRRRISDAGLDRHVSLLGVRTGREKFAAFSRADVLCLPTFYESEAFPVVLLEAMSFGLPTVATRWRGVPSIVDEGVTGFLVDVRDSAAVVDRLCRIAADEDLRILMGHRAREKYLREYTQETFISRMQRAFAEVALDQEGNGFPTQQADTPWSQEA